jgi:hypothetical protein
LAGPLTKEVIMKRALCLFTFAAALSTSAFAAPAPSAAAGEPPATVCAAAFDGASAVSFAADSSAKKDKCPREGIFCTDIYDPVICSDGEVYGNACYAYVACATGCVPYDDGV